MGKVLIRSVGEVEVSKFPDLRGVTAVGPIVSRAVVSETGRPLLLWQHELSAGSEIHWNEPTEGHLVYVWRGEVSAGHPKLESNDALIVERKGRGVLKADSGPATVVHFLAPARNPKQVYSAGKFHVLKKKSAPQYFHPQVAITLYADSSCDTCEMWFHSGESPAGMQNFVEQPHSHSQDEIIL